MALGDYDRQVAAQEALIEMNQRIKSQESSGGGGGGGGQGCGCNPLILIGIIVILGLLVWIIELIYMNFF